MSAPDKGKPLHARLKPDPADTARRCWVADDVARLQAALAARGIVADADVVFAAWERHSETHAAGWLALYEDDADNCAALLTHLDLFNEPESG